MDRRRAQGCKYGIFGASIIKGRHGLPISIMSGDLTIPPPGEARGSQQAAREYKLEQGFVVTSCLRRMLLLTDPKKTCKHPSNGANAGVFDSVSFVPDNISRYEIVSQRLLMGCCMYKRSSDIYREEYNNENINEMQ